MKNKKEQTALSGKNQWAFIAKSYLALAYIGLQELENKKYFYKEKASILRSGQWQVYDAQLLLIPIIWNFKHAIELILKAHSVTFQGKYLKTHNTKILKTSLSKILDIKEKDKHFNEFVNTIDKYYRLKFFGGKLFTSSQILDINNDIFRYPESSKLKFQLDLKKFQKITQKEIDELKKDIELVYRRLAIPAEYKHLKKYWKEWVCF